VWKAPSTKVTWPGSNPNSAATSSASRPGARSPSIPIILPMIRVMRATAHATVVLDALHRLLDIDHVQRRAKLLGCEQAERRQHS
jgi:hypothetical protein